VVTAGARSRMTRAGPTGEAGCRAGRGSRVSRNPEAELVARILVGIGCAFALIAGPVLARELGGVRLLGFFGGSITLGDDGRAPELDQPDGGSHSSHAAPGCAIPSSAAERLPPR
jgi:hypothetical protein